MKLEVDTIALRKEVEAEIGGYYPTEFRPIENDDELQVYADLLSDVKASQNTIKRSLDSVLAPIQHIRQNVNSVYAPWLDNFSAAERNLKKVIATYQWEQRRAAEEAAAKARAEAQAEAQRLMAEAENLRESGFSEDAEEIDDILDKMATLPPSIAPPVAKATGVHTRDNWKAEVVDLKALVKAIAAGNAPLNLVQANLPALNALARGLKGSAAIPGVRVYNDQTVVARR